MAHDAGRRANVVLQQKALRFGRQSSNCASAACGQKGGQKRAHWSESPWVAGGRYGH